MSKLDAVMAHHDSVWHGVARYSVYSNRWPSKEKITVDTGLEYSEALETAEKRQKHAGGKGVGHTNFGIQLENNEEALSAVRAANIWDALTQ